MRRLELIVGYYFIEVTISTFKGIYQCHRAHNKHIYIPHSILSTFPHRIASKLMHEHTQKYFIYFAKQLDKILVYKSMRKNMSLESKFWIIFFENNYSEYFFYVCAVIQFQMFDSFVLHFVSFARQNECECGTFHCRTNETVKSLCTSKSESLSDFHSKCVCFTCLLFFSFIRLVSLRRSSYMPKYRFLIWFVMVIMFHAISVLCVVRWTVMSACGGRWVLALAKIDIKLPKI